MPVWTSASFVNIADLPVLEWGAGHSIQAHRDYGKPTYKVIGVDVRQSEKADVVADAGEPWPFPDESIYGIYTSHMVEHLTYRQADVFIHEAYRVLKPNAKIIVYVPSWLWCVFSYYELELMWPPPGWVNTLLGHNEHEFDSHKTIWTDKSLAEFLTSGGFKDVKASDGRAGSELLGTGVK